MTNCSSTEAFPELFVGQADKAVYIAKNHGCNRWAF